MFYHYSQNNSGGSFIFNEEDGITHHVVIEAGSVGESHKRAQNIGLYFDGRSEGLDCDCCGDRWYALGCEDGDEKPSVYGSVLGIKTKEGWGWMKDGYETVVHFKDGTKKWYGNDNVENTNT